MQPILSEKKSLAVHPRDRWGICLTLLVWCASSLSLEAQRSFELPSSAAQPAAANSGESSAGSGDPRTAGSSAEAELQQKAERLEPVIYRNPRPGRTFDLWCQYFLDAGSPERLQQRVDEKATGSTDYRAHLVQGLVCERFGKTEDALSAYRRACELDDRQALPHMLLGTLLQQQQQWEAAAKELSSSLSLSSSRQDQLQLARQLAVVYQRLGQRERALDLWKTIAQRFSGDVRVLTEFATRLQHEGQAEAALALWDNVRKLAASDPVRRVEVEIQMAELYLQTDQPEEALTLLRPLLTQVQTGNWQSERLNRLIEQATLQQAGPAGLVEFWQQQVRSRPDDLAVQVQLARALAQVDRVDEAHQQLEAVLKRAPDRQDLRQESIDLLCRAGEFDKARIQAEQLTRLAPQDSTVWLQLGQLQLQAAEGEPQSLQRKAVAAWQQMTKVRPDDVALALQAAEACRAAIEGRSIRAERPSPLERLSPGLCEANGVLLQAAEDFCREAIRRAPSNARPREALGELLHWIGRSEEAVATWQQLAEPGNGTQLDEASRILARHGYLDPAISLAEQAARTDPQKLDYARHWIELLIQDERVDQALVAATSLISQPFRGRAEADVLELFVSASAAAGVVPQQIAQWQQLPTGADEYRSHWLHGLLLAARGERQSAAEAFDTALQLRPDDPRIVRALAQLHEQAGNSELAVQQYQRLVVLEPDRRREDTARILQLELQQDHLDQAQAAADELARWAPDDPAVLQLRAAVALRRGTPQDQLAVLEQAVQVAPRDLPLRRQWVEACRNAGQLDRAFQEALQCFELSESLSEKRSVLAWILDWTTENRHREKLLAELQRACQRDPESYELARCLADALIAVDRPEDALQQLQALQQRYPGDVSLLRDLVDVAEAVQQFSTAVRYQQLLLQRDQSVSERERLARLLRYDDRREDALAVWDELLQQQMSEGETLSVVDGLLQRQDLFQAQRFVEWGLAHYPENWRLAYRSALLHLALKQPHAARAALESILRLQSAPSQNRRTAQDPAVLIDDELLATVAAWQQWQELRLQVERSGANSLHSLNLFFRPPVLNAGGDESLPRVQLYSAVALLTWVAENDDQLTWLGSDSSEEGQNRDWIRTAALATWVTHRDTDCRALLKQLARQAPDDALPRLMWIVDPPCTFNAVETQDPSALTELNTSWRWLRTEWPDLPRPLHDLVVAQFIYYPDRDAVLNVAKEYVMSAQTLADLAAWLPLYRLLGDRADQDAFLERAAELVAEDVSSSVADRQDLLAFAVDVEPSGAGPIRLPLQRLLQADLSRGMEDSAPAESVRSITRSAARSATALLAALRKRAQTEIELSAIRPAETESTGRSRSARLVRARQQQDVVRGAMTGEFLRNGQLLATRPPVTQPVAEQLPRSVHFPNAGEFFSDASLSLLQRVAQLNESPGRTKWLVEWLGKQADPGDPVPLQMAQAYVQWWDDRADESLATLRQVVQAHPHHSRVRLELVRLLLAENQLAESLEELDAAYATSSWDAQGIALRDALARRFSELAFLRDCMGHSGVVHSLAFSPDGRMLASASVDGTVRLWDVATGQSRFTLPDHKNIVLAVAFSPRGECLASAGYDRSVRLWNPTDGTALGSLPGHAAAVRCLVFSPDGQQLISGADDHSIRVWNVAEQREMDELRGHRDAILSLEFLPSGTMLASGSSDHTIRLWSWPDGELTTTLALPGGTPQDLVCLQESRLLSTTGGSQLVSWQQAGESWTSTELAVFGAPRSAAYSPVANLLAVGCEDHGILIWDLTADRESILLRGHTGRVLSVAFSPDGTLLASAGFDGVVKLWRVDAVVESAARNEAAARAESIRLRPVSTRPAVRSSGHVATPAKPKPVQESVPTAR